MAVASQGSLEVDQTLRIARDAIERDIARYRIVAFGSVVVLTIVLRLTHLSSVWEPTYVFTGALLYAVLIRLYLAHYGNPPALAVVALVFDLVVNATSFIVAARYDTPEARAGGIAFVSYIFGPALILTLLINALRNSATMSLIGVVVTLGIFFSVVTHVAGFHPAQISVALIIVLAGVIGVASAFQARKSLDSFARLQLLRRYLPPEAVERIMREDPDAALALGGRLVTVTLLAADLRGFTAMSEKLSPGEVMTQLNAYHGAMIDVIERHGGAIDKFIGDGTLVVFGLTGAPTDAAQAAVACAGAMLDALAVHNGERGRGGKTPLVMGIAVHTGPVIAGNLGVPGRRLEFTVIGDAVNTVSRLEGQTKASGSPVIVSNDTVTLLPNTNALRELAPVSLRGKEREVRVFGLVSAPTLPPPPRLAETLE